MGIIRGGLLVIVSVLLFSSFLFGNLFMTLALSLDYDNVQSGLTSIVKDMFEDQVNLDQLVTDELPFMQEYCMNYSEYVFNQQGYTFVIPCEVVSQGPEAVILESFSSLIEEIYYKDYECGFLDCIKETDTQFFYISEQAKDYWKGKFYLSLLISVVLVALGFLLTEKRTTYTIVIGVLLAVSSIPFLLSNKLLVKWIPESVFGEYFQQLFAIFFTESFTVFLIAFISGLLVLGIGVLLKFFLVGFKISEVFARKEKVTKKDVKNIVKEEASKGKKKK